MRYLLGLGNYAMGDDGIGLRIVEHIADNHLDDGFEAVEIGNNGMQVLTYFEPETDGVVIVDAADFGGQPGDWIAFGPEDVDSRKVVGTISTHEGDVLKLVQLARQIGQPVPPIRIVAIQPASMTMGDGLSAAVAARFADYVAVALKEVQS